MKIPNFKEPGLTALLVDLDKSVEKLRRDAVLKTEAAGEIFLSAPNGDIYQLTVSDLGALVVTYVRAG